MYFFLYGWVCVMHYLGSASDLIFPFIKCLTLGEPICKTAAFFDR
jgi:hypothetical protein